MFFNREPALIIGALNAIIALAVGFGLPITPGQVGLINAAVAAVLAVVTRTQVTSNEKSDDLIRTAVNLPTGTRVEDVKKIQEASEP